MGKKKTRKTLIEISTPKGRLVLREVAGKGYVLSGPNVHRNYGTLYGAKKALEVHRERLRP